MRPAATIADFHSSCHGSFTLHTFALTPECLKSLDLDVGKDDFLMLMMAVRKWMINAKSLPRGQGAICIDCDCEFSNANRPMGFVIAVPFANRAISMVTGVCANCLLKPDLHDATMRRLRKIWPDLRAIEGGRS